MSTLPRTLLRPAVLATVVAVAAATAPAVPAAAATTGPGSRQLAAARARLTPDARTAAEQSVAARLDARLVGDAALGDDVVGLVVDAATGRVVWSRGADSARMPASTTKLATGLAALHALGPSTRLTTSVVRGAGAEQVVLVGAGDPSLSSTQLGRLADAAAADLAARGLRSAAVVVDDSLFPAPSSAPGWVSGYVPTQVRAVRALVVDERHAADTSLDAGQVLARQLEARGVATTSVVRGTAPRGATVLGRSAGDTVAAIVRRMLLRSDNDHAEALFRLTALARSGTATWAGAAAENRRVLTSLGIAGDAFTLHDGSGLSRSNRVTPRSLVDMVALSESAEHPEFAAFRDGGLPVAGLTGTLSTSLGRFASAPSSCARGRLTGKTGNLTGAQSLAGVATGTDGRERLYAFVVSGQPAALTTKQAVDRLAATVTGCM